MRRATRPHDAFRHGARPRPPGPGSANVRRGLGSPRGALPATSPSFARGVTPHGPGQVGERAHTRTLVRASSPHLPEVGSAGLSTGAGRGGTGGGAEKTPWAVR